MYVIVLYDYVPFEAFGNLIENVDCRSDDKTGGACVHDGVAKKAQSASSVHGMFANANDT